MESGNEKLNSETNEFPHDMLLHYHLMHPGGDSWPADPNAAFCLDGVYHLHYILQHSWKGDESFSFVHVTSEDMIHWTWQPTKLQPAFTGHGMFSGTGFLTREGRPAVIYHGQGAGRNQIALAKDRQLSGWEKPYPVETKTADGAEASIRQWDPDCFRIGDTYYAISGRADPPLLKSRDLRNWTLVGDFMHHEPDDVVIGEDISCPNFFPLGNKWMLLCISHPFGCRYYLGDWDAEAEQFVPEQHARMNWRRPDQTIYNTWYRDFFAPETVLTGNRRRIMWAWLKTLHEASAMRSVQSLPRELSLGDDGSLRIHPLRELTSLREEPVVFRGVTVTPPEKPHSAEAFEHVTDIDHEAFEILMTVDRQQAKRKRFGLRLFVGEDHPGLDIMVRPETGTLRVGTVDAPFRVAALPEDEDIELRVFVDKYLVEVFANGRQAVAAAHMEYYKASGLEIYSYGGSTTVRDITIWPMRFANQGLLEAAESRIWEPETA